MIQFPYPLLSGICVERYKEFFATIRLNNGEEITAHCPNAGKLLGLSERGIKVWVTHNDFPNSFVKNHATELKYTWELVEINTLIGINTSVPKFLIKKSLKQKNFPLLKAYYKDLVYIEEEYRFTSEHSVRKFDSLLLARFKKNILIKVIAVNCANDKTAFFPDYETEKDTQHIKEIILEIKKEKLLGVVIFVIQRDDCINFRVAKEIDPAFAKAYEEAKNSGITFLALTCNISLEQISLSGKSIPILGYYG